MKPRIDGERGPIATAVAQNIADDLQLEAWGRFGDGMSCGGVWIQELDQSYDFPVNLFDRHTDAVIADERVPLGQPDDAWARAVIDA